MPLTMKAGPNEALIVLDRKEPKVLTGGGRVFLGWFLRDAYSLSLELISVPVCARDAKTADEVVVSVDTLTQVEVDYRDKEKLIIAARLFLGKEPDAVVSTLAGIIDGQIRATLSSMGAEQLRKRDELIGELCRGISARLVNFGMKLEDFFLNDIKIHSE